MSKAVSMPRGTEKGVIENCGIKTMRAKSCASLCLFGDVQAAWSERRSSLVSDQVLAQIKPCGQGKKPPR